MAFYDNGRVIYYGYTNKGNPKYSTLLASNPSRTSSYYPTMAYYGTEKAIYYGYSTIPTSFSSTTPSPSYRNQSGVDRDSYTDYNAPTHEALSVLHYTGAVENLQSSPIRMRATPLGERESFEREAERTRATPKEIEAALQIGPVDAAGYYRRANAYKDLNNYNDAIRDYDEVIRLDPENAYAYYKRGLCYTALQRMDLATEDFRKANDLMNGREPAWYQPVHTRYPQQGY